MITTSKETAIQPVAKPMRNIGGWREGSREKGARKGGGFHRLPSCKTLSSTLLQKQHEQRPVR